MVAVAKRATARRSTASVSRWACFVTLISVNVAIAKIRKKK